MLKASALLTQAHLNTMVCATPGCDHTGHDGLVLHSRCHRRAATWATYEEGVLTVSCADCDRIIARIAVQA